MISPPRDPIDELDGLLVDAANAADSDEMMLLSQVDGLIAAALVAPGPLDEAVWLPAIWGGGDAPFDAAARDRLRALVMARRTAVVGELLQGDMAYGPLYDVDPNDDLPLWEFWIEGFAAGVALADAAWLSLTAHNDEDLAAAALGLSLLIALADDPRRNPELAEQAPDLIPYLVETLHRRQRGLPRIVLDASAAGLPGLI